MKVFFLSLSLCLRLLCILIAVLINPSNRKASLCTEITGELRIINCFKWKLNGEHWTMMDYHYTIKWIEMFVHEVNEWSFFGVYIFDIISYTLWHDSVPLSHIFQSSSCFKCEKKVGSDASNFHPALLYVCVCQMPVTLCNGEMVYHIYAHLHIPLCTHPTTNYASHHRQQYFSCFAMACSTI